MVDGMRIHSIWRALLVGAALQGPVEALSRMPVPPLRERVAAAEEVAIVTLTQREERGEWARGTLRIDHPIHGSPAGTELPVIWRTTLDDTPIYDAAVGARGIAVLKDRHQGRYWLGQDKLLAFDKLAQVMQVVGGEPQDRPSYEAWLQAGKPVPKTMNSVGGSVWFDPTTGKQREPRAVYERIYGKRPEAGEQRIFPPSWGAPPERQTRDLRQLPGGYGRGSGTLAAWIEKHLAAPSTGR